MVSDPDAGLAGVMLKKIALGTGLLQIGKYQRA